VMAVPAPIGTEHSAEPGETASATVSAD
jgi:hypothetical protein